MSVSSEVQRARANIRWQKHRAGVSQANDQHKLTPEQHATLMAGLRQGMDVILAALDAAGMRGIVRTTPTDLLRQRVPGGDRTAGDGSHRGSISYKTPSGKKKSFIPESHFGLPAEVLPESIWKRAERRLEAEGPDAPDGYWARKTRLYQAALEECVEDCERPELKARQILTLISMFHSMKDVYLRKGETAKRITREEEEAMEAEVANLSDEELLKLEKGE